MRRMTEFIVGLTYSMSFLGIYLLSACVLTEIYYGLKLLTISVAYVIILFVLSLIWDHSRTFYIGAIIGALPGVLVFMIELSIGVLLVFLPFLGGFWGTASGNVFAVMIGHSVSTVMLLLSVYFGYVVTNAKPISVRDIGLAIGYNLFFSLVSFHASMWNFYFSVFMMPVILYVILRLFSNNSKVFRGVTLTVFILITMPAINALTCYFTDKYGIRGFDLFPSSLMQLFLPCCVVAVAFFDYVFSSIISAIKRLLT